MSDPDVSFTNNTAELRMAKVKIKVSGASGVRPRLVPDIELSRYNGRTRMAQFANCREAWSDRKVGCTQPARGSVET